MRATGIPSGDGRVVVWLMFGTPHTQMLTITSPGHAEKIIAAVNAPGAAGLPVLAAVSSPGYLDNRLADRSLRRRACPVGDRCGTIKGWEAFLTHIYAQHTSGPAPYRHDQVQAILERGYRRG